MSHSDSNRTADRKASDLTRKAARRAKFAAVPLDVKALERELSDARATRTIFAGFGMTR